ncbi:acyl-CoA dehydrogenase family protein [Bordetella sp. 15P40C-2]|uniref:acyl-CoA dehydrogenase family protein n=1 Tax=Bordetella sp. 15P40C-2 TaxID=2572246 RepID=UPI0013263E33|nr:acyl-CoA dehydrogenase family protein [Bordetella sp. 15P40C-2]MVW70126.1 acyl-CoA dehydrogenase [Bordetella sp. 15P40C-2]
MNFTYTEEQRMLDDSLRRLMQESWNMAARRARAERCALDAGAWAQLADLGVLGLNIATEHGGFGEPPASLLPVHMALGRGLVAEPVIPSGVMSASLLAASDNPAMQQQWLPALASGGAILSVAYQEPGRRYATEPALCRVSPCDDGGLRLSGTKQLVWHGASAHGWIVSALAASGDPVLLLVPSAAPGVVIQDTPTLDRTRCARLEFTDTIVDAQAVVAWGDQARVALAGALDWGTAALCAHAAGAMERLLEITVDYLKTRRQFGQPLAAFQVLQHRLADMLIAKEMALSMAYVAVAALSEPDLAQRCRMLASAKFETARAGRYLAQSAVQLHGGMGMTDELEVGDYFKRLTVIDLLFGDMAEQLATLSNLA